MNILSVVFAIFLILLFVTILLTKDENSRQNILLVASYVFYAYADVRFMPVLLAQTIVAYSSGRVFSIRNTHFKKWMFIMAIALEIGMLATFKYDRRIMINAGGGYESQKIMMPFGLSFYTFQAVSYIVDTYKGTMPVEKSIKKVALYIGFFPQITSGPIVKAHNFFSQLEKEHPFKMQNIIDGGQIFLMGVVKKTVVADRLGRAVDAVYAVPEVYSGITILMTTIAYSIQLYFDFSGYSDMAVGIGKCLGYDLGRNFNMPYIARNPAEFWRRWHISLSEWFKEYVYFPLGGNRKRFGRSCCNVLVVMLLSGIWHGAGWTFVLWGFYHGVGSIVHRLAIELMNRKNWHVQSVAGKKIGNAASILLTFLFVNTGWILFRADSLDTALTVMGRILTMEDGIQYIYVYTIIFAILLVIFSLYVILRKNGGASYIFLDYSKFSSWFFLWTVLLLTLAFFYSGDTAFIYGGF